MKTTTKVSATSVLLITAVGLSVAWMSQRTGANQPLPPAIQESHDLLVAYLTNLRDASSDVARIPILLDMADEGRRRIAAGEPGASNFIRVAALQFHAMNLKDDARSLWRELTSPKFQTATRADAWRWLGYASTDAAEQERCYRNALAQFEADNVGYLDLADDITDRLANLLDKQGRHAERAALYESQRTLRDAYADDDRKAWITLQIARAHADDNDLAQARNWYDRFTTEHPRFTTGGVSWIQFRIEAIRLNGKLSQYDPEVVAALEALWNDPATADDPSSLRVALLLAVPNREIRSHDEAWAWSEAMLSRALGLEAAGTLKPYLERPENHSFAVMSLERQLANLATADAQWVEPFESLEAARLHQRLFPDGTNRNRVRDRLRNGP